MSDELSQAEQSKQGRPANKGLHVEPSPLNGVKLDLGIFLLIGLVLLIVVEKIALSETVRLLILAGWAVAMLLWVVIKSRRIIEKTARNASLSGNSRSQNAPASQNSQSDGE